MVALCNRADDICFHPVVCSIFLSSFFFSSPNLSRRRLHVCHTSAHGVALVRIQDAGLKRAAACMRLAGNARRKKSPKSRHLRTIVQLCWAISSQLMLQKPEPKTGARKLASVSGASVIQSGTEFFWRQILESDRTCSISRQNPATT